MKNLSLLTTLILTSSSIALADDPAEIPVESDYYQLPPFLFRKER